MPGMAASTSETWLFGSPPKAVDAPENSFDFEVTWACTSMPITTSQSPVAPLISLWGGADALMWIDFRLWFSDIRISGTGLGFAQRIAAVKPGPEGIARLAR